MQLYKVTLQLQSPIVTPLKGDTLFGQFCWAYRELMGEEQLKVFLSGYMVKPKLIFSDVFISGNLPRPQYPFAQIENKLSVKQQEMLVKNRKNIKRAKTIPAKLIFNQDMTLSDYMLSLLEQNSDEDIGEYNHKKFVQSHNTINRDTGTTGDGIFSPYAVTATSYRSDEPFDLYILIDDINLVVEDVENCLQHIGLFGFGADATIGMGKFKLNGKLNKIDMSKLAPSKYYMNLSPMIVSSNNNINLDKSYYNLFTRFGRMGNINSFSENPFKSPIVTIDSGSLIHYNNASGVYCAGCGINTLVKQDNSIVYQGYSIILPILI